MFGGGLEIQYKSIRVLKLEVEIVGFLLTFLSFL